jgi:hypothetical protein
VFGDMQVPVVDGIKAAAKEANVHQPRTFLDGVNKFANGVLQASEKINEVRTKK